jgi:hypothetical protein
MRGTRPVEERAMDVTGWLKRALGIAPPPAAASPPPPRYPPERYLESAFPAPRTRFREEEQERRAAAERWVAEVSEAFGFLCRAHGATIRFKDVETRRQVAAVDLPRFSIHLTSRSPGCLLRVPLAVDGAPPEVYEFDLAEMTWYAVTLSPRRGALPPVYAARSGDLEPVGVIARRLAAYCSAELEGDLSSFEAMVALRREGGTPNPRGARWREFTTHPNQPWGRDEVNLPSPDGRYVATMGGVSEFGMCGPLHGILRLSTGQVVPDCHPHMVWADDSRHLAVLRLDLEKRETRLAVVRASGGSVRELETDRTICFPRLVSFRDGLVSTDGPAPFDVSHLCA